MHCWAENVSSAAGTENENCWTENVSFCTDLHTFFTFGVGLSSLNNGLPENFSALLLPALVSTSWLTLYTVCTI